MGIIPVAEMEKAYKISLANFEPEKLAQKKKGAKNAQNHAKMTKIAQKTQKPLKTRVKKIKK